MSLARAGLLRTAHGVVETPVFMPVGTRGALKACTFDQLRALNPSIILSNAYHLALRPGMEVIQEAGGLHAFSGWDRAFLTDSGGFQVFSLSRLRKVTEEGVHFRSHIDGSPLFLGPKESMEVQRILGSDICMVFDECVPALASREEVLAGMERTHRWARVCRDYPMQEHQRVFAIVQGGVDPELRRESATFLRALDFPGYAIGGLAVGEPAEVMYQVLDIVTPLLPRQKPRYLMGVGTPRNLVEGVMRGVDMFDCVMPTRNARNGTAFTWSGKINVKAAKYARDFSPLDPLVHSEATKHSRAYLRHLLNVSETAGWTLLTLHNVAFYLDFMQQLREAILEGELQEFYKRVCAIYPT